MDRNGRLAAFVSPIANWASDRKNGMTRAAMEGVAGIDRRAELPKFNARTFVLRDRGEPGSANTSAPAYGKRKAVIFPTCFVNYNKPADRHRGARCANHLGVETKVVYPGCCGMPFLEQADLDRVAKHGAEGFVEAAAFYRRRLRHHYADRHLRADAEIRMAAHLPKTTMSSALQVGLRHR